MLAVLENIEYVVFLYIYKVKEFSDLLNPLLPYIKHIAPVLTEGSRNMATSKSEKSEINQSHKLAI